LLRFALGRDSQRIALLFHVWEDFSSSPGEHCRDEQIALFTYIFILCAGLLIMAWRRDWAMARACLLRSQTQFYFWGWYDTF